jgi:hypothetical protein
MLSWTKEELEEEKRVMYVGATRAKVGKNQNNDEYDAAGDAQLDAVFPVVQGARSSSWLPGNCIALAQHPMLQKMLGVAGLQLTPLCTVYTMRSTC